MGPLSPELYKRLEEKFGKVKIANAGRKSAVDTIVRSDVRPLSLMETKSTERRPSVVRRQVVTKSTGEYYRINCPFCRTDKNFRLWIHYRYVEFPQLAICYRRNCLSHPANRSMLRSMLLGRGWAKSLSAETIGDYDDEIEDILEEVKVPGLIIPLTSLPADDPCVSYLRDVRKFDIEHLTNRWGVGWCHSVDDQEHIALTDRIYAPIRMDSVLVGWQGRHYVDGLRGKYYFLPGMKKSLILYNYDTAKNYKNVILMEGITDVWRTGDQAMAVFGHTLSTGQLKRILEWRGVGSVGICFDSDDPDALRESREIEISLRPTMGGRIFRIQLPDKKDPADFDADVLWTHILEAAARAGVEFERGV